MAKLKNFNGRYCEQEFENAFISYLVEEEWQYLAGSSIIRDSQRDVLYTDENKLLPEYLCMFFNRKEFDRYARFHSWGSARETFTWNDLIEVEIPIPDIEIQESISNIYKVYNIRKEINEKLKTQIKNICPILIKGSLEE